MNPLPWIQLLAYQERARAQPRPSGGQDEQIAARIGQRVIDDLGGAIVRDLERARDGAGTAARKFTCVPAGASRGMRVEVTDGGAGLRTLSVTLIGGSVICRYGADATTRRTEPDEVTFAPDQRALVVWEQGVARRFNALADLSAFLVAPLLAK